MKSTEAKTWRNRIVGSDAVAPGDLLANPNNWRTHPGRQRDALRGALDSVGWVQQVIVNTTTGHLVDGHARVEEAITRGEPTVPVLYVELTPEEEGLVLATLDPISAMATQDDDRLRQLLAEVEFDSRELAESVTGLLPDVAKVGKTDPDDVPEPPAEPWVKRGDLFALGDHRLLCGDATNGEDYDRVLGGQKAVMVFTDPPWNVAIGQDSNPRHRQRAGLVNDSMPSADFAKFLRAFANECVGRVSGDFYCVLGASEWPALDAALRDVGFHWSATVIWVKDLFVLGRSKYHRRYEPIWFGWPSASSSSFCDRRDLDDVWEIARPRRSEEHPTMKPVELVERALVNSSAPGDVVLDPFSGSGTIILAAERSGRKAAAIDIDPKYVQVTIQRWEDFTGRKAEKLDVGSLQSTAR